MPLLLDPLASCLCYWTSKLRAYSTGSSGLVPFYASYRTRHRSSSSTTSSGRGEVIVDQDRSPATSSAQGEDIETETQPYSIVSTGESSTTVSSVQPIVTSSHIAVVKYACTPYYYLTLTSTASAQLTPWPEYIIAVSTRLRDTSTAVYLIHLLPLPCRRCYRRLLRTKHKGILNTYTDRVPISR